jgi:hypothetical protein
MSAKRDRPDGDGPASTRLEIDRTQRSSGDELLGQLRRRHEAAKRIPGGDPCSPAERALGRTREHRWPDHSALTVNTDAAVDAVEHLLAHHLLPIVDTDTCRALWRAGHRELAVDLARLAGAA